MSNTITAFFKGRIGVAESVYQNDYGIVMVFDSIELPAHFDCYFSVPGSDTSTPAVGADNRVVIPNTVLGNSGSMSVHIPLHTGENDSEVEYVAYFKVIGRARPEDDGTPAQMTAIEQALALLQQPIGNIEQIVNEALAFTGDTFAEMKAELQGDYDDFVGDVEDDLTAFKSEIRDNISDVESDFSELQAGFDEAVSAVTTDTEVTNIRVGNDAHTYTTAGEATRTQFQNVKKNISSITGNDTITFIGGYYITTSGATVDIENPTASNTGYAYAVVACQEGDSFRVSGQGGASPRLWCFVDDSGNSLKVAAENVTTTDLLITAPPDSAYLVLNSKSGSLCYKNESLKNIVSKTSNEVQNLEVNGRLSHKFDFEFGYIGDSTGVPSASPSAYDIRTSDFHVFDDSAVHFHKNGVSVKVFRYNRSSGTYIGYWYSAASQTSWVIRPNPLEKYKIQITTSTPVYSPLDIERKASIYIESSDFIQRGEFDGLMYIKQDMSKYESEGWIRASDGQYFSSTATKMYKYKNTGYTKGKVFSKTGTNTLAVAAFYSSDSISTATFLSAEAYKYENIWYTQEFDIPANCDTIAISVYNPEGDYSPSIELSSDGVIHAMMSLFTEEGSEWED